MKIVLMHDSFPPTSFGGGGISTYELARGLQKAGHQVSVITTCREKSAAGTHEYHGVTVHRIASNYPERWRWYVSLYNPRVVRQIARILRVTAPDIVQIGNAHQHLSYRCFKIAKRHAKAVVFIARDVMTFNYAKLTTSRYLERLDARTTWRDHIRQAGKRYNPLRNIIIKHYLRYADKVVAISEALRTALGQNGIRCDTVIYNGIHSDEWRVSPDAVARFKDAHKLAGKKVLLFGGRLSEAKGAEKGLEALAHVVKDEPNAVLLCLGKIDRYAELMREKARALHIEDHVMFGGWMEGDELKAAYGAADVVWMLSICFDSFGRVNIEAMSAGKPVVGTSFGGTPEVVEHGVTGYIVNPLYPDEIAERTLDLLRHPARAEQFGRVGRERVERLFSMDVVTKNMLALYKSLLK